MSKTVTLRPNQTPSTDAKVFLLSGGRGSGKTLAGALWAIQNGITTLVIARTSADSYEVVHRGESGIYGNIPGGLASEPDGIMAPMYSSARPTEEGTKQRFIYSYREQLDSVLNEINRSEIVITHVWIDELSGWKKADWALLMEALPQAKVFVGFTPGESKLEKQLRRRVLALPNDYELKTTSLLDNASNLNQNYTLQLIKTYAKTSVEQAYLKGLPLD